MPYQNQNHGFTLIELSIVLVIIGLIAGGVLVGQDLISAASIRAQVSQFEKYNAAVNTFRVKYNAIPGDFYGAYATQFGFAARTGAAGRGNGDGLLGTAASGSTICGETVLFWADLSFAQLIDGNYIGIDGETPGCQTAANLTAVQQLVPAAKFNKAASILVLTDTNTYANIFLISGHRIVDALGQGGSIANPLFIPMSPTEAYQVDAKTDDGLPGSGRVLARGSGGMFTNPSLLAPGAAASGQCASNTTTPVTYNINPSTGGNEKLCGLSAQFQ